MQLILCVSYLQGVQLIVEQVAMYPSVLLHFAKSSVLTNTGSAQQLRCTEACGIRALCIVLNQLLLLTTV